MPGEKGVGETEVNEGLNNPGTARNNNRLTEQWDTEEALRD